MTRVEGARAAAMLNSRAELLLEVPEDRARRALGQAFRVIDASTGAYEAYSVVRLQGELGQAAEFSGADACGRET